MRIDACPNPTQRSIFQLANTFGLEAEVSDTQEDIAHLLDLPQSVVSDLENGGMRPSLEQITALSLIYGRSFESLFAEVMAEARIELATRVGTIATVPSVQSQTFNRDGSLQRLSQRLTNPEHHG